MTPLNSPATGEARHAAEHWARLIDEALLHAHDERPSLSRSLTRLTYLREATAPQADWDELTWLRNEIHAHDRRRRTKHPLFKWGPRAGLQEQIHAFQLRGAVKLAALVRVHEQWCLAILARRAAQSPEVKPRPPSWTPVEALSRVLEDPEHPIPPTQEIAEFLTRLLPSAEFLFQQCIGADSPDSLEATWNHFRWHTTEASLPSTSPFWLHRLRRKDPRNALFTIAIEEGIKLLQGIHEALLVADLGGPLPVAPTP